jgi:hypothetical protein
MTRDDLDALAAALELPSAAAREQRLHLTRGKRRARNSGPKGGQLTLTAAIAAAIARQRHGMPCRLIGALLDADESTISLATRRIAPLLDQQGTTITPAGTRISTLSELREYSAGITLPGPPKLHTTPESTLQTPGTPQTHVISGRVQLAPDPSAHTIIRATPERLLFDPPGSEADRGSPHIMAR